MKTHIISNENVATLRDIQVTFALNGGMVVVVQVEIYSDFVGSYELADLQKFSPSSLSRLEEICMNWFNAKFSFPQDKYNNDDLTIA